MAQSGCCQPPAAATTVTHAVGPGRMPCQTGSSGRHNAPNRRATSPDFRSAALATSAFERLSKSSALTASSYGCSSRIHRVGARTVLVQDVEVQSVSGHHLVTGIAPCEVLPPCITGQTAGFVN